MYHSLAQFHWSDFFFESFTFLLINDSVVLNEVADDDVDGGELLSVNDK